MQHDRVYNTCMVPAGPLVFIAMGVHETLITDYEVLLRNIAPVLWQLAECMPMAVCYVMHTYHKTKRSAIAKATDHAELGDPAVHQNYALYAYK